ncbi:MAG: endonuclease domain-containing protein [Nitrospinaceae bacterium]|nr:endonuclease domain-containing protein [Nitrospinaceae bacterium]
MAKIFNKNTERAKRKSLRKKMPPAEMALWQVLRNRQANGHKFRRQYSVDRYILDFYCPSAKLAIEIDGDSHFTESAVQADRVRQKAIEELGIRFLRFTNQEVYESLDDVFDKILKHLSPLPS